MNLVRTRPAARAATGDLVAALLLAGALTGVGAPLVGPAFSAAAETRAASPASVVPPDAGARFTLAVLPDTRLYARDDAELRRTYGANPFDRQVAFLTRHKDDLNIPFAVHLGDVVEQVDDVAQWRTVDRALAVLEHGGVPYSILPGDHDLRDPADGLYDTDYNLANEPFMQYLGPDRARVATPTTFQGNDPTGLSQYHVFSAEGHQFLVLALAWRVSEDTLAWATGVIAEHPNLPVILTTHQLVDAAPDGSSSISTDYGRLVWDELVARNDQIFLTLNGHTPGAARQTRLNDAGHPVTQLVLGAQTAYEGGDGYLGLCEFDLTHDRITLQTASPWVAGKPVAGRAPGEQVFLTGEDGDVTVPLDFGERFAGFDPDWDARTATPDRPDLAAVARHLLDAVPEAPTVSLTATPASGRPNQQVTLEAAVGGDVPDGSTVRFADDGAALASVPATAGSTASVTTTALGAGPHELVAVLIGPDGAVLATSPAVAVRYALPDDGGGGEGATDPQTVRLDLPAGAISVTTPYSPDHPLDLGTAVLDPATSTYRASAPLGDIVITDTRAGDVGFTASAVVSAFVGPGGAVGGEHAGLTDLGATQVPGNALLATDLVLTDHPALADGLGSPRAFVHYPQGRPTGTARIHGMLGLGGVTTSSAPGLYTATVTFTAV